MRTSTFSALRAMLCLPVILGVLNACKGKEAELLFPQSPGMVSYTYRNSFQTDLVATLDTIKELGVTDMEFSNLFGHTADEIRLLLDERGMVCSSYGVNYDALVNKTQETGEAARTLGAQFVRVAWIPHGDTFTVETADKAIADFNSAGKLLKDSFGLSFCYHNHGYEFVPYEDGTLFDYLARNTDPEYVNFEIDILWTFFPGVDPAALIDTYGDRFKLMHLKDLRKGVDGNISGGTSVDNDVTLGTGQLDIPSILKAARKAGVLHYYIEDESPSYALQVPQTIAYLHSLRY